MDIIYKKGDMFEGPEPWLLHGANAQSVMASGVAKTVKELYPSAYQAYLAMKDIGHMRLGGVSFAAQEDGKVMFNGITQEFYGRDGKRYVDYDAVKEVIQAMDHMAILEHNQHEGTIHVAMPKIGAGLGGGDWGTIACIIEDYSLHFQPVVYLKD